MVITSLYLYVNNNRNGRRYFFGEIKFVPFNYDLKKSVVNSSFNSHYLKQVIRFGYWFPCSIAGSTPILFVSSFQLF
jgi:hypothetical protein